MPGKKHEKKPKRFSRLNPKNQKIQDLRKKRIAKHNAENAVKQEKKKREDFKKTQRMVEASLYNAVAADPVIAMILKSAVEKAKKKKK
jgi:hypothetical protein